MRIEPVTIRQHLYLAALAGASPNASVLAHRLAFSSACMYILHGMDGTPVLWDAD